MTRKEKNLAAIGEAAKILGVSIDTLRRWDKSGKLHSTKSSGGHRLYDRQALEMYLNDMLSMAKNWALNASEIPEQFYCPNSAVFQTRLIDMEQALAVDARLQTLFPLIVAVAGEIGNNSFDHNLGNWPDVPGIFFGYDIHKHIIVLADRGQGILATLRRVRPDLATDQEALRVAFTEIISGRAPESRGNGLKFVRKVAAENPLGLLFQTGDAELQIAKESYDLQIHRSSTPFRGCLAMISF